MADENQPVSTGAPGVPTSEVRGPTDVQNGSWWVRRYGSYRVVALDLVLAVAIQIVLSVVLIAVSALVRRMAGSGPAGGVNWLVTSPLALPIGVVLTDVGLIVLLWYRVSRHHLGWSLLGVAPSQLRPGRGRAIGIGVVAGLAMIAVSDVLGQLLQRLGLDQSGQYKQLIVPLQNAPAWIIVLTILLGTFLAPVVEELFFRGYIFHSLRATKGALWAYIISASAFAAVHLLPEQFPVFLAAGLILAFAYERSGNMLTNITAHALNNGISFVIAFLPTLLHH